MQLPDFEDMAKLIDEIKVLSLKKAFLEIEIKKMENDVFSTAQFDTNGKPLSTTFIENAYKHSGIHGEILPFRIELARVSSQLEGERLKFDMMQMTIEIWRSEQANNRISLTSA